MNKPIDPEGFYTGPELKWSVEDVECIVLATLSPDIHFPGTGLFLQDKECRNP